jgi:RHS repeat-associated protein
VGWEGDPARQAIAGDGERVPGEPALSDDEGAGPARVDGGGREVLSGEEVITKYYFLGSQRVAMRQDGDVYYFHTDHLGSTSAMSDNEGNAYGEPVRYLPFGEVRSGDLGSLPTDHGFTGQKHSDGVGLIFMQARYYLPGLGRFASADTIVPDGSHPQDFNRYSYVRNRPLHLVDPTGHTCANPSNPNEEAACYTAEHEILESSIILVFRYYAYEVDDLGRVVKSWNIERGLGTLLDSNIVYTHDHWDWAQLEQVDMRSIEVYGADGDLIRKPEPESIDYRIEGEAGVLVFESSAMRGGPMARLGDPNMLVSGTELAQVVRHGGNTAFVQWVEFDGWSAGGTAEELYYTTGSVVLGDSGGGNFRNGQWVGANWAHTQPPSSRTLVAVGPLQVQAED